MSLRELQGRLTGLIFGRVVERSAGEQRLADEACRELTLYHYPACPFCIRVRRALRRMSLHIEGRDIRLDPSALEELREQGGKNQVPCLRIERAGEPVRWLYESADIIRYLERRFPPPSPPG